MPIPTFVRKLTGDLFIQIRGRILGIEIMKLGLKKQHRDINRRLKIYRAWGRKVVSERVEEIKSNIEEEKIKENSNDLIEAIVRNSLKEKKEGELVYTEQDIFDEFSTFFMAGVDTTSNYLVMMIYLLAQHTEV